MKAPLPQPIAPVLPAKRAYFQRQRRYFSVSSLFQVVVLKAAPDLECGS